MQNQFLKKYLFVTALLLMVSCRVMLIGAYDAVTDMSIQKIQNDVSALLVRIENNITDNNTADNKYQNFKSAYENIEGELQSLQIRTRALPKYQTVTDQLVPFDSTIHKLERFHKLGFNVSDTGALRVIKQTIEFDFKQMIILQNGLKRKTS